VEPQEASCSQGVEGKSRPRNSRSKDRKGKEEEEEEGEGVGTFHQLDCIWHLGVGTSPHGRAEAEIDSG